MEEMTVVGTSILDLCVVLLGALKVDSCPARIALGPGLGVKAPYFPHQLAEQIPVQDMAPGRVQSKVKSQHRRKSRGQPGQRPPKESWLPPAWYPDQTLARYAAFSAQFSPAPREPRLPRNT